MEEMKLTVYTLAIGDYSDCLGRALESVKSADEIVVQCGDDEKTREIAKKYTDKVFTDYKWNDDGGEARNHVIKKCTGDWILELDCDNWLEEGGIEKIKKIIDMSHHDVLSVTLSNFPHHHNLPLLFKNDPKYFYVGSVHEILNTPAKAGSNITIYEGVSTKRNNDPGRNLRRLKAALDKNPDLVREKFYYGREYYDSKYYYNAIYWLDKYLQKATWLPEKAEAYYYKALSLWKTSQGELARQSCLMAIEINANMKKALELMAEMSWPKNRERWLDFAKHATNEGVVFA